MDQPVLWFVFMRVGRCVLLVLVVVTLSGGCSTRRIGLNRMADAMTATAQTYARDNDPEFVRLAAPSTLKMVEMLLEQAPAHRGLLLTACSGFAQYSYAFLHTEADGLQLTDPATARDTRGEAGRMYERAKGYCFRALEVSHPALTATLAAEPARALGITTVADVPALYWTAVAWGGAVSASQNPLARVGDLVAVRLLLARALALDEAWQAGAIHEALIALDGLPPLLGGSAARARAHFDRAVELSHGESAFAYLTMATSVAQPARDQGEFERLLRAAMSVDVARRPNLRMTNLVAQRRAKFLLSRVNQLF